MPIVLAFIILRHPEWTGWNLFLAWCLWRDRFRLRSVREAVKAGPAYVRDWAAAERARTRHHGKRPERGASRPLPGFEGIMGRAKSCPDR